MDAVDLRILSLLQDNARMTQVEISRAVRLTPSAVLDRLRKLEARGAIAGFAALINPKVAERRMLAFVAVQTSERPGDDRVSHALAKMPDVLEVHHVAGEDCLLLKVRARDAEHLGELLRKRLGRIPGIRNTRTTIVLETIKETPRLPLPAAEGPGTR
jgi:Lrp/AsnC family leucine-responsive transcriptional regulator